MGTLGFSDFTVPADRVLLWDLHFAEAARGIRSAIDAGGWMSCPEAARIGRVSSQDDSSTIYRRGERGTPVICRCHTSQPNENALPICCAEFSYLPPTLGIRIFSSF